MCKLQSAQTEVEEELLLFLFGCYHSERLESRNLCECGVCVQVLLGLDDPAVVLSAVINGSGWKFGVSGQQMSTLHCLITAITSVIS